MILNIIMATVRITTTKLTGYHEQYHGHCFITTNKLRRDPLRTKCIVTIITNKLTNDPQMIKFIIAMTTTKPTSYPEK